MAVSDTQIYAVINDYLQLHLFLYTFLQATFKSFVIISSVDMQFIFSSVFSVSSLSAWILSLVFFSPFKKRWKIIIYFSYLFNLFKCRPYLYTKRTICQHKIFGVNALIFYFIFATTLQMSSLLLTCVLSFVPFIAFTAVIISLIMYCKSQRQHEMYLTVNCLFLEEKS